MLGKSRLIWVLGETTDSLFPPDKELKSNLGLDYFIQMLNQLASFFITELLHFPDFNIISFFGPFGFDASGAVVCSDVPVVHAIY